jgi:hypothetical protein
MDALSKDIQKALSYDPLSEAEQITGESYRDSDVTTGLGFLLMHKNREHKDALLHLTNDTNSYNQTPDEWVSVVESLGFELVLEDPMKSGDTFRVWWNPSISALLVADTYWKGETINSAKCYFVVEYDDRLNWNTFDGCSHGPIGDGNIRHVSYDSREGLRHVLSRFQAGARFILQWPETPFLWLLSHEDTKAEGYSYDAITAERISLLPDHVRKAISQ